MSSVKQSMSVDGTPKSAISLEALFDNKEIAMEILLRQPIKDLLRLKCVSKQWLSIISDPLFGHNHCRRNPLGDDLVGLYLYRLSHPHHFELQFVFLDGPANIAPFESLRFVDANSDIHDMWSCNGFLCVSVVSYVTKAHTYYICNPTTKKSVELPSFTRPLSSRVLSMNLAFDPWCSVHYHVVCVWVYGPCYHFSIYSSKTKMWRDSGGELEIGRDDDYLFKKGVYWNNGIHWVSESGCFLHFDLGEETIDKMPATSIADEAKSRVIQYFGECNGHLFLAESEVSRQNFLYIFALKIDYSEWVLRHSVDLDDLSSELPSVNSWETAFNVFCIFSLEEDDSLALVLSRSKTTLLYSIQEDEILQKLQCDVPGKPIDFPGFRWYHAHKYILSLCSL